MKRKATIAAETLEAAQQSGRRQPQTSCLNCRAKKIKCDRGLPCASCVIRGISCIGQPGSKPAVIPQNNVVDSGADTSILSRLASLERAVFGDARPTPDTVHGNGPSLGTKSILQSSSASSADITINTPTPSPPQDIERQQAAMLLDFTHTGDGHSIPTKSNCIPFHVAPASSHQRLSGKHSSGTEFQSRSVLMMTREEALLLLCDFCENPYHLLQIIYEPSARSLINTFYTQLESGHEGDPTAAALILSIASTSASFFHHRSTHKIFASIEEADQASAAWRQAALAILDETQFSTQGSLERCQARAIIAYVVSNVEGCSARYRLLHSYSMAIARDMSLHLIDSPTMAADKSDDLLTKEMKRRLWWHLASTDWLLSLVGGPLDGTYTVQPRHFVVNRPRNINDSDLSQSETLSYPSHVLTQVSCYLQRIRLGELCRDLADARPDGLLGVDITDFDTIASLDRLFEEALAEMPPSFRQDAPIPEGAPLYHAQQRDLILLCFNFRRARLHRPFLLHDTDNPLHEASRRRCLASARAVLSISTKMLEGPSAVRPDKDLGHPLAYRAGLVISAIFTACSILALNAGLVWSRSKGDTPEMHGEINEACRVLAKAGEKSIFAANLVRNLVGVLKQYSVKDIDYLVVPPRHPDANYKYAAGNNDNTFPTNAPGDQLQSVSGPVNLVDDFSMWNGFFTTIPEVEEHDQFFAGLDYYCGPT